MKLSIVVPCYNEAENIPLILARFSEIVNRPDVEVILVNNGSHDNSKEVLDTLLPQYSFAKTINIEVNKGYGFGIVSGLKEGQGEFLSYTHADMQTDPADLIKALNIIEAEEQRLDCYVKGDRKGRPFFDQFFTSGMSLFETIYMNTKLWDINAQPNLFSRKFFESLHDIPDDFSLDLYFLYKAKKLGLKVVRFDVRFPERLHGESSWNTGFSAKWKFIKRTFNFSIKLKRHLK